MISLPDELLARVDAEAARRGMSRSGVLRHLALSGLEDAEAHRREEMRALNARARHRGGDSLAQLKARRPR